jgi:hypothetical protein
MGVHRRLIHRGHHGHSGHRYEDQGQSGGGSDQPATLRSSLGVTDPRADNPLAKMTLSQPCGLTGRRIFHP